MLNVLASGTLHTVPRRQTGRDRTYVCALMRVPAEGSDALIVSIAAFAEPIATELLSLKKGDALAVTGRGKLDIWSKENSQKHGLHLVIERIVSLTLPKHLQIAASIGQAGANATNCPSTEEEENHAIN